MSCLWTVCVKTRLVVRCLRVVCVRVVFFFSLVKVVVMVVCCSNVVVEVVFAVVRRVEGVCGAGAFIVVDPISG
jgi:hypothetical protein